MLRVMCSLGTLLLLAVTNEISAEQPAPGASPSSVTMLRRSQSGLVLLVRQDVAKDLELIPSQEEAIRTLVASLPSQMKALVLECRGLTEEQRRDKVADFSTRLRTDANDLLLPHQLVRLNQITLQIRIDAPNVVDSLVSDEVIRMLGLTEVQIDRLRSRRPELSTMYRNQIAEARKRVTAVMLAELTPEQKAKWNAMVGEPFIEDPGFELSDIEAEFMTNRREPRPQ